MENKKYQKIIDKAKQTDTEITLMRTLIDPNVFACILKKDRYRCFGIESNAELALIKAYSEFMERKKFRELADLGLARTSNGFAAHETLELASRSAINELIERDVFLTSWVTRNSPYWLRENEIFELGGHEVINFIETFRKSSFELNYGILGVSRDIMVVVGCILMPNDKSFGFALDTAASSNFSQAAKKIYYSNCHLGSIALNRKFRKTNDYFSSPLEVNSVEANFEYYLNRKNRPSWFFETTSDIKIFPGFEIIVETIEEQIDPPLVIVRANSDFCQHYFAGKPTGKKLNLKRISEVFPNQKIYNNSHALA